jgi:hypothetical protein
MEVMFNVQIGDLRVIESYNWLRSIMGRLGTSFLVMSRLEYNAVGNGTAIG